MKKIFYKKNKIIAALFFIFYLAALFKVLFFKYPFFEVVRITQYGERNIFFSINLIPFKTILNYLSGDATLKIAFKNLIGNIVIFLPLGFLLPILFKKIDSYKKILFVSFAFSLIAEATQLFFGIGSFDVDDLLLNALGGILGFAVLRFAKLHYKKYIRNRNLIA